MHAITLKIAAAFFQVVLMGGAVPQGGTEVAPVDAGVPAAVFSSSKTTVCGDDDERTYNAVRLGPSGNSVGPWNCWLGTDPTVDALVRSLP